jgi:hypothetical protein
MRTIKTILFALALGLAFSPSRASAQVCPLDVTFSMASQIALIGASWPGWGCNCYGNIDDGCRGASAFGGVGYKFNHPGLIPTTNGICGADKGIQSPVQSVFGVSLRECCGRHDLDYANCQKPKDQSDLHLEDCIVNECAALASHPVLYAVCIEVGALYHTLVHFGGFEAHRITQNDFCLCSPCGPNWPCFYGGDFGSLGPLPQQPWYPWWPTDFGDYDASR